MKLFANGCSFTWGGAIYPDLHDDKGELLDYANTTELNQQRLATVWPSKLGKLIDATETVNMGMGCGSNDRIVRTTMDYFAHLLEQGQELSDWLAVIQWTQAHRYEYWDDETNTWAMVIPNGISFGKRVKWSYTESKEYERNITYSYLNDTSFSQKYFTQVVGLASFFDQHKIKYRFMNLSIDHISGLNTAQVNYLTKNIKWVGDNVYITINNMFKDAHESKHPTVVGHDQIASNLFRYIKNDISN